MTHINNSETTRLNFNLNTSAFPTKIRPTFDFQKRTTVI